jgi:hypothetical protein
MIVKKAGKAVENQENKLTFTGAFINKYNIALACSENFTYPYITIS